ncbi:hypothetical protein MTo_04427 [Microcystis aeruginosa NIES-1211]|uniref:Transposase n=1 Tax=Microcystis aeruginosa NIES-2519 TaxID=2303981 RepID=A0A5A5R918_MICAE|nr:hypothetical protein MTo_04427 [Microcystis aeruginosa NIES-1211]GCA73033.1 hypothetical protein MiYa_04592 [Microcystis aeruginosa NIES-2519]GCA86517.1 hypothetical protein MiHa_04511 [Microcystis aeruginosa NIES-2522]
MVDACYLQLLIRPVCLYKMLHFSMRLSCQTNPIERLNNTFRQRISRPVRESLSFSKMDNHIGAIYLVFYP